MKLSNIRKELPFKVSKSVCVFIYMKDIVKHGYELDFDVFLPSKNKNLQRPLVWNIKQKRELIFSILKGVKIPDISVLITDHKKYSIIDGKQRLSTIIAFINNEFSLEYEGKEYFFNDCEDEIQRELLYYSPMGNIAYDYEDTPLSDENKILWFEMINFAGTPQDIEHLNNLKS